MDFVANDMKFDYFIIKQWGGRFKVWGSGFRVVVAASPRVYMGRCPKAAFKLQVTSHQSLGTPNP